MGNPSPPPLQGCLNYRTFFFWFLFAQLVLEITILKKKKKKLPLPEKTKKKKNKIKKETTHPPQEQQIAFQRQTPQLIAQRQNAHLPAPEFSYARQQPVKYI